MLQITKIFTFEMAHAIHNYDGACKNIHGHSYKLHVSVTTADAPDQYIPSPGLIVDFKELKKLVSSVVIEPLDHKLILSHSFITANKGIDTQDNLVVWEAEPTVENLLIFIQDTLTKKLPGNILLVALKLYETRDSYAEWINRKI